VVWDPASVPASDGPIPGEAVKLVIEVTDASLPDDLGQKLLDYAQAGLPEHWVADVTARVLHICTGPNPQGYQRRRVVRFGKAAAAETSALQIDVTAL
jgi:Uma2 family endonuclease